ncbi:O-antigen ligase [Chitinibacter sp. GC72]|uniref:O-antigen ligase family protein n=1 Tax=Chitinibacter sp. GC72 TaxID=1526917 RepID=UPI0012FA672F|nr:O-antigen ligase family protein [Chitinibacter sp. GC72]
MVNSAALRSDRDAPLFWLLILQLVWAPLPLASNRTWAVGILLLLTCALWLGAVWIFRGQWSAVWGRCLQFKLPIGILLSILLLVTLQTIPLPYSILTILSPTVAETWHSVAPSGSASLSLNAAHTQLQAALCLIYASAFLFTVLLVRSARRLNALAYALIVMALFQALLGGYLFSVEAQYELFTSEVLHDRMRGTFVYHNNTAAMLAMCLSVGIGLFLVQLEKSSPATSKRWLVHGLDFLLSRKMLLRLALVILVIALVMTRSRMGNAGFFIAMLLSLALYAVYSQKTRKVVLVLLASLIVIDIWVLGQWVGLDKVVARLEATQVSKAEKNQLAARAQQQASDELNFVKPRLEESIEERALPVAYARPAIADYFWFGSGAGTFYSIFPQYRPAESRGYYDHAHNDYVEILTDYGVIGASLFALLVLASFWRIIRTIQTRSHPVAKGIALGALMAMLEIVLHSTVDFNLQIPANALLITVIIALGWCASQVDKTPPSLTRVPPPAAD